MNCLVSFSKARLTCFDNPPQSITSQADEPIFKNAGPTTVLGGDEKRFSQAELNSFLNVEKRREREARAAERNELKAQIEAIQSQASTTAAQRQELTNLVDQLRSQNGEHQQVLDGRTKAWENEKKQLNDSLSKTQSDYFDYRVTQELFTTTLSGKYAPANPSHTIALFRQENDVRFLPGGDVDPNTGETRGPRTVVIGKKGAEHSLAEVYQKWSEDANNAHLFKSNMKSGAGQWNAGSMSGGRQIDPRTLSTAEYMRIRKENPALLGLEGKKR